MFTLLARWRAAKFAVKEIVEAVKLLKDIIVDTPVEHIGRRILNQDFQHQKNKPPVVNSANVAKKKEDGEIDDEFYVVDTDRKSKP